jgi:hypothetical protein
VVDLLEEPRIRARLGTFDAAYHLLSADLRFP